ncbi:MAG TPA: hypothetical protein VGJ26_13060 [Pirellulales bacterium]|jgi:hypothetical protein
MKTYFCPGCGRGYESSECGGHARSFRVEMRCPRCGTSVEISGAVFIVFGLLIGLLLGLGLDTTSPMIGAALAAGFSAFGAFRCLRQFLARHRADVV